MQPIFLAAFLGCGHPSDEALMVNFEHHRGDFNQLLEMIQRDVNAKRIASDFMIPEGVISEERWSQYRELFRSAGVADGVTNWAPSGPVVFIASAKGFVTGGSMKGYAYLPRPPEPQALYESLDSRPASLASNARAYRPIAEDWYIYYGWDD
jgi:hypothetical protein